MKRARLRAAILLLALMFVLSGAVSCGSSERRSATIESFTRSANDRTLSVRITVDQCSTIGTPQVTETDSAVIVRISESTDYRTKCDSIQPVQKDFEVELSAPLGRRAVRG